MEKYFKKVYKKPYLTNVIFQSRIVQVVLPMVETDPTLDQINTEEP